jgi:hypothetical protein
MRNLFTLRSNLAGRPSTRNFQAEGITWIPVENGPPEIEGLYLVTRYDGRYRAVIMENWAGVPKAVPAQWDGDAPRGEPEEGPVIAWAQVPKGYVEK